MNPIEIVLAILTTLIILFFSVVINTMWDSWSNLKSMIGHKVKHSSSFTCAIAGWRNLFGSGVSIRDYFTMMINDYPILVFRRWHDTETDSWIAYTVGFLFFFTYTFKISWKISWRVKEEKYIPQVGHDVVARRKVSSSNTSTNPFPSDTVAGPVVDVSDTHYTISFSCDTVVGPVVDVSDTHCTIRTNVGSTIEMTHLLPLHEWKFTFLHPSTITSKETP